MLALRCHQKQWRHKHYTTRRFVCSVNGPLLQWLNVFLRTRRYVSAGRTSCGLCLSVCLSQVVVLSEGMNGLIWFLAWMLSTSPTLVKGNSAIYKNKGTSLWNFFLKLRIRHGISIIERAINLARERWTLRARDKLDRRWSTKSNTSELRRSTTVVYHRDRRTFDFVAGVN